MATNLSIDPELLERVREVSGERTKKAAVTKALEETTAIVDDDVEVLEELDQIDVSSLERQSGEAPIIRLVNLMLMSSIQKGASDIHIEPYEKEFRVRFRIDGILYNVMAPPMKFRDAISSRSTVACSTRRHAPRLGRRIPARAARSHARGRRRACRASARATRAGSLIGR